MSEERLGTVSRLQVNLLLKEYVLSGDTAEAERCLRELEVPHFHHEFVYEVNPLPRVRARTRHPAARTYSTRAPCVLVGTKMYKMRADYSVCGDGFILR